MQFGEQYEGEEMVTAGIELASRDHKTLWSVFEMVVDDDVTMGQIADTAKFIQKLPRYSSMVYRIMKVKRMCLQFCTRSEWLTNLLLNNPEPSLMVVRRNFLRVSLSNKQQRDFTIDGR